MYTKVRKRDGTSKMRSEDQNYESALKKYKDAKQCFDRALSQYNLYGGEFRVGEYYSVSGIKIDMPFVPSSDNKVKTMVDLLGDIEGKKGADLGSGDGKVVLSLLNCKADAYGFELEPSLVKRAKDNLKKSDYQGDRIISKNFMDTDLSSFDFFTLYGISSMMEKLEKKLLREANSGTLIVSNTFIFPNLNEIKKSQNVYLYLIEKGKKHEQL